MAIKSSLNNLLTDVINGLARQAVALKLDFNVFGTLGEKEDERMIRPSDFKAYNFEVKFDATDPAEDDRRLLVGRSLLDTVTPDGIPAISLQTFMEQFAKKISPNYDEEMVRILTERVVFQLISSGALTEALLEEIAAEETSQQQNSLIGELTDRVSEQIPGARERNIEGIQGAPTERTRSLAGEGRDTTGV